MKALRGNKKIESKTIAVNNAIYKLRLRQINLVGMSPYVFVEDNYDEPELIIEADQNLIDNVKVSVLDNVIDICTDDRYMYEFSKLLLTVRMKVDELSLSGCYNLRTNICNVEKIDLSLQGCNTSDVLIKGTKSVNLKASGSSSVLMGGSTKIFSADLSGTTKVDAFDLTAEKVVAHVKGTSNLNVCVLHDLLADVEGVSNFKYKGDPEKIKTNVSGLGQINKVPS